MDNPRELPIVAPNSDIVGQISVNVVPCYADGDEDIDEDAIPDEPSELIGSDLPFKVKIDSLSNLPENFCRNMFVEY